MFTSGILFRAFGDSKPILSFSASNELALLVNTTIFLVIAWLLSCVLLGLNEILTKYLEGYLPLNPLGVLRGNELRKYREMRKELNEIEASVEEYEDKGEEVPDEVEKRWATLAREIVLQFPDREEFILPTSFGNAIRAFEVYPRVMYGLEAIDGWMRLVSVIPDNFLNFIDSAKTNVNFWMNLVYLILVLQIQYVYLIVVHSEFYWPLFLIISSVLAYMCYRLAVGAAIEWGKTVKAAFDVYLPNLCNKLGLEISDDAKNRRAIFESFSQAVVYRERDFMPTRNFINESD